MTAIRFRTFVPTPFRNESDQAFLILAWGIWCHPLFRSFIGQFIDAQAAPTSRLLAPMPLYVWSSIAVGLGLYRYWASRLLGLNHREYAATLCSIFWLTIAVLFLLRLPYTTGTIVYLGLAYQSLASMGRIRMLR